MELILVRLGLYAALAVLSVTPLLFIANHVYQDGAFGRASLAAISTAASCMFVEGVFLDCDVAVMHKLGTLLIVAFAVFITWHLVRFHRRVLLGLPHEATPQRVAAPVRAGFKLG